MAEFVVRVKHGLISGKKEKSMNFNTEFYSFYGVPYAEPPIESLRFKDPVKIQPWEGIRNGTSPRDSFIQYSFSEGRMVGSENSLYVNIHTPELPQEGEPLKAVVVMIHPGGQAWGSPNPDHHGSPDYIMHNDIVYVTICYRLNIFGFLNLKMNECSGNQGLKDIIMAFQWVHENIHVFNGDARNITALGASSGAVLVHYLLLSPAAKGLFHKAIMMGQYVFNCLTPHCEDQTARAFDFANDIGFRGDNPKELLIFLKKIPAEDIVKAMSTFQIKIENDTFKSFVGNPFTESIDSHILPVSPRLLIPATQQMPIIFGICEREAVLGFLDKDRETYEKKFIDGTMYRQSQWGWPRNLTDKELEQLNHRIHTFYQQYMPKETTPLNRKIDIASDAAYSEVYDTLIDVISPNYPAYVYKFQYEGEIAEMKIVISALINEKIPGTFRCDDYRYWAYGGFAPPKTPKTRQIISTITKMFGCFAKTGNPNYENIDTPWIPTTPENPCHLSIGEETMMIDGKLNGKRLEFWDDMKKQFKRD